MNAFNNQKPYKGVTYDKKSGYMYHECYNDGKTSDFRQFFNSREEAEDFAKSRDSK